jgi:hypothetical protein
MNPRHAAALALVGWYLMLPSTTLSQTASTSETGTFEFSQADLAKLAKMGPYNPARAVLPDPPPSSRAIIAERKKRWGRSMRKKRDAPAPC